MSVNVFENGQLKKIAGNAIKEADSVIIGKIYNGVASQNLALYGISANNTVEEAINMIPENTVAYIENNGGQNAFTNSLPVPGGAGCAVLFHGNVNRGWAEYHTYTDSLVYFAKLFNSTLSEWHNNDTAVTIEDTSDGITIFRIGRLVVISISKYVTMEVGWNIIFNSAPTVFGDDYVFSTFHNANGSEAGVLEAKGTRIRAEIPGMTSSKVILIRGQIIYISEE